tara:strand:- start:6775 stop:7461 length:687 start_codon:yes stop_codon:yes gene_type:complete
MNSNPEIIKIKYTQVTNQQRFPISKYGWPLYEAAKIIINGKDGWHSESIEIFDEFISKRVRMQSLSDLYGITELKKWPIDCVFLPWFSVKPIKTKTIFDHDYDKDASSKKIIKKLENLILSLEKGYIHESGNNICIYPIAKNSDRFYVRAGNHRVAILAALDKEIPCSIDKLVYLKERDKEIISKRFLGIGPRKIYKEYPSINEIINWPAVVSQNISINTAEKLRRLF